MSSPYKTVRLPDGTVQALHRKIMEEKLRRKLRTWEVVHHRNENKQDDRPQNLQVVPLPQHTRHHMKGKTVSSKTRRKLSALNQGSRHPQSKTSEATVHRIRSKVSQGTSPRKVARSEGMKVSRVYDIVERRTWTHV